MRVAVCYFGLTRSTRYVYKSHHDHLFDVLKRNNIDYKIFMHTWKVNQNIVWDKSYKQPIDEQEYTLLKPDVYVIQNQDEYTTELMNNFHKYFYAHIFSTVGHNERGEWLPMLIRNHMCALESQRRVFELTKDEEFDAVIFIRPDALLLNDLDVSYIKTLEKSDIVLIKSTSLQNASWEGYNDQFCIGHPATIDKYANRINEIEEFRKTRGRIVSEKYVKYIVDKYGYNKRWIEFNTNLVRPNGEQRFTEREWSTEIVR